MRRHDHTNQRLHKSSSLGHTHFIYDESGHLLAERVNSASGTQIRYHIYLPMGTGLGQSANLESGQGTNLAIALATQDISPQGVASATRHYAVQTDHQGSPRQIIDHTRQTQWQWPLSAFGEIPPNTAANKFNAADTPATPVAGAIQLTHNLRYAGQYFDQETNLFDNWHRTYNPQTGRYTQSDPIGLEGGWNRWGYAEGNALSFNDPKGQSVAIGAAGLGGLLLGGAILSTPAGQKAARNFIDGIREMCEPDEPECRTASDRELRNMGIDAHEYKTDHGALPWSKFDICICKDGQLRIARTGQCGRTNKFWW